MDKSLKFLLFGAVAFVAISACSVVKKAEKLRADGAEGATISAITDVRFDAADSLALGAKNGQAAVKEEDLQALAVQDTTKDGDYVMKNVKDSLTGEEMLMDRIAPSIIVSRFAQRQERGGNVPIDFQIRVPSGMIDNNWQVNLYPEMYLVNSHVEQNVYEILQKDSLGMIEINGKRIPRIRERGYGQFEKFMETDYPNALEKMSDTTRFLDKTRYRVFLDRDFAGVWTGEERAEYHYTWATIKKHYRNIAEGKDSVFAKMVKYPYHDCEIRLDTIMRRGDEFLYDYSLNVSTKGRPLLNKALIYLSGEVVHNRDTMCAIPRTDSLEYTISSVFDMIKDTVMHKVIWVPTHLDASSEYNILFKVAKTNLDETIGDNAAQIAEIKHKITELMHNEKYLLDSIVVTATASPEGSYRLNRKLSEGRSASVRDYFVPFVNSLRDSIVTAARDSMLKEGKTISVVLDYDAEGNVVERSSREAEFKVNVPDINFLPKSEPENWEKLAEMMAVSEDFTESEKSAFFDRLDIANPDRREAAMRADSYYRRMRDAFYPSLRVVKFEFMLHLKETINRRIVTDEIDDVYMAGLAALKDRDWEGGLEILKDGYPDDYNLGVAYLMMDRNANARVILEKQERTSDVNYMLAIAYMRLGMEKEACEVFLLSCEADKSKYWRGNKDPEIKRIINKYQITYDSIGKDRAAEEAAKQ